MNKMIQKAKSAFTIVETTIYILLLAIVLMGLLSISIFLATASVENIQKTLLVSESSVVGNRIFREVKNGQTFLNGSSTLDQASSVLVFTQEDGDQIGLRLNNDYLQMGVNGTYFNLHSDDIIANSFRVEKINTLNQGNLFKFTINFSNIYGNEFTIVRSVNFIYD